MLQNGIFEHFLVKKTTKYCLFQKKALPLQRLMHSYTKKRNNMRKILYILAVAALAMGFASCEGPQGEPGRDGLVNSKIIDFQIDQNEWSYSDIKNNNYFYGAIPVPELTNDIYDNGIIKVYREYNTGTNNKSQVELPYTNFVEYSETVNNETLWGFYQEHVYAEYAVGSVTIFYLASDFDYELNTSFVPEAMHFRMIMMW